MRARWPLYLTAGALLAALWIIAVGLPLARERRDIGSKVSAAETQLNDFRNTIGQLPAVLQARQKLESRLREFNSSLYAKQDVLKLFDRIREDAATNHLSVVEISPSVSELLALNRELTESSEPQFLNIGLRLKGDYLSFGTFVEALERTTYFRGVNWCQIVAGPDRNSPTMFTIGFKALLGRSEAKL